MTPTTLTRSPFSTLIPAVCERPGDDPIFQLNAEAKRRAAAGRSVINATLGALMLDDGTMAVLPVVAEALRAVPLAKAAGYAPIAGDERFRAAVIEDLFGTSTCADSACAVATPGGTGALHAAFMNFLEPGQRALVPNFYWSPYKTLAEHTGRGLETFAMFTAEGRFDIEAFESGLDQLLERQGRALCLLNFPCNNPTGYSLDDEEWAQVAEIVRSRAVHLPVVPIVDHAYAAFAAERSANWVRHAASMAEATTVLVAWTASKSFTQYGARVGALVACTSDDDERTRVRNALGFSCRGTWSNCNHLGMLAVTEMLTRPELRQRVAEERAGLRRLLDGRVDAFNAAATRRGLRYPRYEGGFFVSVFARQPKEAAAHMKEHADAFVVPIQGALRVALCSTPERDVPRLVDAMAAALEARD